MFEAQLAETALLKKIVEATKELVTEVSLDCTQNGLGLQAMDSSHVALCQLQLKSEAFDHFRCDRSLSLGLNLDNLAKILKCAQNSDTVTIKSEDEADKITVMFENEQQDKLMDFDLTLMDLDSEKLEIPETEYKCVVEMSAPEFQKIVRDLSALGDTCWIGCTKEGLNFSVKGDTGTANIALKNNATTDDDSITIEMEEPVNLRFALNFLSTFTKATPLAKRVRISMSLDVPVVIEYAMENVGFIKYFLAPKADEEAA